MLKGGRLESFSNLEFLFVVSVVGGSNGLIKRRNFAMHHASVSPWSRKQVMVTTDVPAV